MFRMQQLLHYSTQHPEVGGRKLVTRFTIPTLLVLWKKTKQPMLTQLLGKQGGRAHVRQQGGQSTRKAADVDTTSWKAGGRSTCSAAGGQSTLGAADADTFCTSGFTRRGRRQPQDPDKHTLGLGSTSCGEKNVFEPTAAETKSEKQSSTPVLQNDANDEPTKENKKRVKEKEEDRC